MLHDDKAETHLDHTVFEKIANSLDRVGFHIESDALCSSDARALIQEMGALQLDGKFSAAGVGRDSRPQRAHEVRHDSIAWFDSNALCPAQAKLWMRLEALRRHINERLFLGLWDLEGHFAIYPSGGGYHRHLDRFQTSDARVVSVVLYLNEDWSESDGGELALFTGDSAPILVRPELGTLVCFLSESVEHEVRRCNRPRRSFAGWFRRRAYLS